MLQPENYSPTGFFVSCVFRRRNSEKNGFSDRPKSGVNPGAVGRMDRVSLREQAPGPSRFIWLLHSLSSEFLCRSHLFNLLEGLGEAVICPRADVLRDRRVCGRSQLGRVVPLSDPRSRSSIEVRKTCLTLSSMRLKGCKKAGFYMYLSCGPRRSRAVGWRE